MLFCLQLVVIVAAVFTIVLVVGPIRRILQPLTRLLTVIGTFIATFGNLIKQVRHSLTEIVSNLSRISALLKRPTKSVKFRPSVSKVFAIIVASKRVMGLIKRFRQRGRSRYWGMFRLLMLAGPVVVPVLSTLRKRVRKPA